MAEEKDQAQAQAQEQTAPKGPFVHQLQVYLVGGQTFTINEVTDSPNMPPTTLSPSSTPGVRSAMCGTARTTTRSSAFA